MNSKPSPSDYIAPTEFRARFPRFKTHSLLNWSTFGHPAINGRLKRKRVPGHNHRYLYNLDQLEKIEAYWEQLDGSITQMEPAPSGYIDTAEIGRRFPGFTTQHLHVWWKFGHPVIGRLKRTTVRGRMRYYQYDLAQLQRIKDHWDQVDESNTSPEVPDQDGSPCLRADLVFAEYGLSLHDLYDWHRVQCPWLDESQNAGKGRMTRRRLRPVRRSHLGKRNKRRYEILYFRRDELEEIKRNQSASKAYKDKGWLFQNGVGNKQGIPPSFFTRWCQKGFPKDAPKLETRWVLCPAPDGRSAWRLMYSPDSIKRLADWYNGLPSADEPYRGDDGTVYRKASFLVRLYSRRTGKRPPSGKLGRPKLRPLTEPLLRRWRGTGCDELDGKILDARLAKMRLSTGRTHDVWVYNVDQVEWMVAARRGEAKPMARDRETEARDRWIYKHVTSGKPRRAIRLRTNRRWPKLPIDSEPGIMDRAKAYAKRNGLPLPTPRKAGRRPR